LPILLVCLSAGFVESATVPLAWDPSPESDVSGYILSYGTTSGQYTSTIDVGFTTTFQFAEPDPTKVYYLALQAYDTAGLLSPYSNEVATTPVQPLTPPLTITNLAANLPSPQLVGATIIFTATATGGTAPYQYKWWISDGATSTVGRNWSTSNIFAWMPGTPNPNYMVTVWARTASSTIDGFDNPSAKLSLTFAINLDTSTPPGGISLVQHWGKDAGTTRSSTLAFMAANTAGNWIGVAIRAGRTGQTFTVTDTRGNTYRRAVQLNDTGSGTTVALFYAENIAGGANTVTVSDTRSGTLRFAILEYAGVATLNSLDGTAASQGFGATANSGPATTTANGDLIVGVIASFAPSLFVAGSGYTLQDQVPAAPNTRLITEDRRQASAGPVSATATTSTAGNWGALLAAFRASGGSGGSTAPTVSSVSPNAGSTAGGADVTITGTNFAGGATVTFGGAAATNVTVVSTTSITARAPAHAAGPVNVVVTTPDMQQGTLANGFTYTATAQPISFIQVAAAVPQSPVATVSVTYPDVQAAGDLNIVVVGWNNDTSTVQAVQDSAGNVYDLAIGPTTATGIRQSIYYASNIRSGSNTVTVIFNQPTAFPDIRVLEYRGVSALDATAGASGNSSFSTSGTATTTSPNELIFGANTVATSTSGAGSGFTSRIITSPDGDIAEDRIVSVTGTYSAAAPLNSAGPWVMQMVTFK
jgi:hypothetical protein